MEPSAVLRDQLVAEIKQVNGADGLALWAHRRLPAKNTLTADDARVVKDAYQAVLASSAGGVVDNLVTPLPKTVRKRNKAHLMFVAAQPCLVCQRTPCDAHHLKFAQPRIARPQGQRRIHRAVMSGPSPAAAPPWQRGGLVGQCSDRPGRDSAKDLWDLTLGRNVSKTRASLPVQPGAQAE